MADTRILSRDCASTMIPSGETFNLPQGTEVTITHRLGDNFTVTCEFGMMRIAGKDADAIGENVVQKGNAAANHDGGPPDIKACWDALKTVFDPEIPVNIVDLGLVYTLEPITMEDGKYKVDCAITLTAPGCGMGPVIAEDARLRLMTVPGVSDAEVSIVWDPPWNQDMISEEGKMELGLI